MTATLEITHPFAAAKAAGRVPFKAETPFAIALKHLSAPMPPPATFNPRLGPAIETVVLKAVARSTADRFKPGEEFATALSTATFAEYPEEKYSAASAPTKSANSASKRSQRSSFPESSLDPVEALRYE